LAISRSPEALSPKANNILVLGVMREAADIGDYLAMIGVDAADLGF